ncbi:hypothetical protein [Streptomyces sp. N35]|nr:hypothetical protein [Streptomyces sp. N35]
MFSAGDTVVLEAILLIRVVAVGLGGDMLATGFEVGLGARDVLRHRS